MSKIKPLQNNVLVEVIAKSERGSETKSGIFIPETIGEDTPEQGKIIEVGPGRRNEDGKIIPMTVKKGQTVIYSYSSREIKEAGKKYSIVSEDSILAVIE